MRRLILPLALIVGAGVLAAAPQARPFFSIGDVRPGMVGVGRTVFAGDQIEEFQVHVLGVLRNVVAPGRDLILARLEGGPLATTGVISGMSGSPVYIDGRLVGAVAYALGSFPREPIAGITPIGEMIDAVSSTAARTPNADLSVRWPATPADVYAALERVAARVLAPIGGLQRDLRVSGPSTLADLAPMLRPIGAAMVLSGFDPSIDRDLRRALHTSASGQSAAPPGDRTVESPLRPGDAVGMSLIRGDFEMGATGTVTYIEGTKVYAFGHPFLNLGPTQFAMTQSRVYTVLPSLDSSMKITTLGSVVGTMTQDRSTAVGGTIGAGPRELEVRLALRSDRAPERQLTFYVLQDQSLMPLFAYVAILNSLLSYERQSGALTVEATGSVSFGRDGTVTLDDCFTGDSAITLAAAGLTAAIGTAAGNDFRPIVAERMDVSLQVSEVQRSTTIERAWLDTTRPRTGATHTLHVLLRDYRGDTETLTMPVTMPDQARGPLTLLVTDGPSLSALEQRDLRPGKATTWDALLSQMNEARRNNRVYVRLLASSTGTVVGGETLPALPASVRSVFDEDKSVATAAVARTVVGSWERRVNRSVRGSRELTITLTDGR